jgi:hypothetical protein
MLGSRFRRHAIRAEGKRTRLGGKKGEEREGLARRPSKSPERGEGQARAKNTKTGKGGACGERPPPKLMLGHSWSQGGVHWTVQSAVCRTQTLHPPRPVPVKTTTVVAGACAMAMKFGAAKPQDQAKDTPARARIQSGGSGGGSRPTASGNARYKTQVGETSPVMILDLSWTRWRWARGGGHAASQRHTM